MVGYTGACAIPRGEEADGGETGRARECHLAAERRRKDEKKKKEKDVLSS